MGTVEIESTREELASAKLTAQRLASAVESMQDAFVLFDHEDKLVLCNSVYRRLIGDCVPGAIVGISYTQLLDAWMDDIAFLDDVERTRFRMERVGRRHEPSTVFDLRMRDGRKLRVVDRRTAEDGIVTTILDMTEDVWLAEKLRQARTAAEAASGAKSDFLSSMSHELRTPLNAVLGFAQLMQRDKKDKLSDHNQERVARILAGGEHLLHLIDDILDLSRIEAGRISIVFEAVSAVGVLDEVKKTLEPMAARQGVRIELTHAKLEADAVLADHTRLVQILMNLGSNAIKYNRSGGEVVFSVCVPRTGYLRMAVRDTGIGIPLEQQAKMFQPFARAGQELGPIEGTGIGLVITRQLAMLMKGDVAFRSVPGEGSEFWVDLPLHTLRAPSSLPAGPHVARLPRLDARRGPILYVEDNAGNVTFMRNLVETMEHLELIVATTAEAGIELAREQKPALIIMDINLPGSSGLDAMRALRRAPETRGIPVIALTAAASERDKQRGLQAGFARYLTKPVKVDELLTTFDELLKAPHD